MSDERAQGDGFRYDSVTDTWDELPDAPIGPRIQPAGAWSGTEFLVWGGWAVEEPIATTEHLNDGAAFNPLTNEWRMLPPAPVDGRTPLSVWTGRELIVWGTNYRVAEPPTDGAAYDPATNEWRRIAEGPIELTDATAVWTGEEMIVFGAELQGGNFAQTAHAIGAAYHPQRDAWRELPPSSLSPQASTASWNGQEMVAWDYENESAAYNPISDTWRELPRVPLNAGECSPSSVAVPPLIYGDYCGSTVIFEPNDERWLLLPGVRNAVDWGQDLVAADPVLLLLAHNLKREDRDMFAFKPSFPRGHSRYHLSLGNIIHRDGRYRLSFAANWRGPAPRRKSGA